MRMVNLGCGARFHPAWINMDANPGGPGVIRRDLTSPLPFENGSIDVIYHSHVLEHLPRGLALPFLRDCFRVLRPGGIMRVVAPDLESIARAYVKSLEEALANVEEAAARHEWMTIELIDQLSRHVPGGEMLAHFKKNPMPAEEFVFERMGGEAREAVRQIRSRPRSGPLLRLENNPARLGGFRLSGECHLWMYDRFSLSRILDRAGFENVTARRADESAIEGFSAYGLDLEPDMSVRKPDSLFMEAFKPAAGAQST